MNWESKRMVRELKQLEPFNATVDGNTIIIKNTVFLLHDKYPFQPPSFKINEKNYISYLAKVFSQYKPLIDKYNIPIDCICCSSITCMWSPCNTCLDIYKEYKKYVSDLKQVVALHYFIKSSKFDDLIHSKISEYLF